MKQLLFALILSIGVSSAQTTVDLRTQVKNVDFSNADWTRPSKTGTALPSICQIGETFFKSDAPPGANLYGCSATNIWSPQSGASPSIITAGTGNPSGGCPDPQGGVFSVYLDTSASTGQNLWACTAANTWSRFVLTNPGDSFSIDGLTSAMAAQSNPAALHVSCIFDNNANTIQCKDTSGNVSSAVRLSTTCGSGQHYSSIDAQGIPVCTADSSAVAPSVRVPFGSRSACNSSIAGQLALITDQAGLSSQCDGTSYADFAFGSIPITRPPSAASFTTVNGGTLADNGGLLTLDKSTPGLGVSLIAIPAGSGAGQASGTWTLTAAFTGIQTGGSSFPECGIWLTNGTTAGISGAKGFVVETDTINNNDRAPIFERVYFPISGTLAGGSIASPSNGVKSSPLQWFRAQRANAGTNDITWSVGDGVSWLSIGTEDFGSAVSHYGFGCDPRGTNTATIKVWHLTLQ